MQRGSSPQMSLLSSNSITLRIISPYHDSLYIFSRRSKCSRTTKTFTNSCYIRAACITLHNIRRHKTHVLSGILSIEYGTAIDVAVPIDKRNVLNQFHIEPAVSGFYIFADPYTRTDDVWVFMNITVVFSCAKLRL